jgi:hypothetical protein
VKEWNELAMVLVQEFILATFIMKWYEADHSPESSAEVECVDLSLHSHNTYTRRSVQLSNKHVFMEWCLVKQREKFIFMLLRFSVERSKNKQ